MHKKYITLFILGFFFLVSPLVSFARIQAVFPDGKTLQPMPQDVAPDISSNVNRADSNTQPSTSAFDNGQTNTKENNILSNMTSDNHHSSNLFQTIFIIVGVFILVIFLVRWFRKRLPLEK